MDCAVLCLSPVDMHTMVLQCVYFSLGKDIGMHIDVNDAFVAEA
jgi:hypothetical protein